MNKKTDIASMHYMLFHALVSVNFISVSVLNWKI